MRRIEQKKYIELSELDPNRHTVRAFLFMAAAVATMFLLNIVGIFHANQVAMNIACIAAFILFVLPKFIFYSDELLSNKCVKYILIGIVLVNTFLLCIMLNFYAMIVLTLPLFLTVYYPSKKLSVIATVGSLCCAIIAPPLSYLIGTWDVGYLAYLLSLISDIRKSVVMHYDPNIQDALFVVLYISLPAALILSALSFITSRQVRVTIANRDNQLAIMSLSELDELTGVLNRRCFREYLKSMDKKNPDSVMVVYFDVNGLHELNNEKGHDAGDRLLRETAKEILKYYDEEQVFRLGGDEFVVVYLNPDVQAQSRNLELIRSYLEGEHYFVSYGMAAQPFPCDLDLLVRTAESRMSKNKYLFYEQRGFDRRGQVVGARGIYDPELAMKESER